MRLVDPILMELDQEGQTTKRVLERIPDDKLSWKPHPKSFSLGQLGMHIAAAPGNLATAISMDSFEVPNFVQSSPATRKEILDAFTSSLANAKGTLGKMDDAKLTAM